jgi:hypothetical protein
MIHITRENGIEVDVEPNNDPAAVERLLRKVLTPGVYADMKKKLLSGGEEIFFEFTGVNKEEFPLLRHYLVHLDSCPARRKSLTRGNFYITFYVHKDHLSKAEEMAKHMKSHFKNLNDWNETNEHGVETGKFFQIPPMNID